MNKRNSGRRIVWFSCGAASAVAAKLAVTEDPTVEMVYCEMGKSEHPDNKRFLKDVENWVGKKVTLIKSDKFNTIDEVFEKRKYLAGIAGAPCTKMMKIKPRLDFQRSDDTQMFGFTIDEIHRSTRFEYNNPEILTEWPLIDQKLTKKDCLAMISQAGIEIPTMYKLGYSCNNCPGCVKAASPNYWRMINRDFPEVFKRRAEQERRFGAKICKVKGERVHLDEIDLSVPIKKDNIDISCGLLCQIAMEDLK